MNPKRKTAIVVKCATPTCKTRLFFYEGEEMPQAKAKTYCPRCRARRERRKFEPLHGI